MYQLAINGFGRIGRNILRALYERPELREKLRVVAINDLGDVEINAHLLQFDSVHGRFNQPVSVDGDYLCIGDDRILCCSQRDPAAIDWADLGVDLVCECTGLFTAREKAALHLAGGAKKVLVSAPGTDMDATVVYGINHEVIGASHTIVSNASCTTNCLAPVAAPLHAALGIESGFMTTVHSYTNDQNLSDVYHSDVYRARSATQSMIPTKTGAAAAIGLVIPELAGRLDGGAVRVPTINVSLVDFTFNASRATSVAEVNKILADAAAGPLAAVLHYNDKPLVSVDFNHIAFSSNFDATQTRVHGSLVKVMAWYDNEWGFSNRMLDNALVMLEA
jgi:glyceraldehyde 3-phosphate dehydrogenase